MFNQKRAAARLAIVRKQQEIRAAADALDTARAGWHRSCGEASALQTAILLTLELNYTDRAPLIAALEARRAAAIRTGDEQMAAWQHQISVKSNREQELKAMTGEW